jgi:hypothetical protein
MTEEEFDSLADGSWKYEIESLRQRVAELEVERDMLSAGLGVAQGLTAQLAACEKERDELKSARPVCIGCCKAIDEAMK